MEEQGDSVNITESDVDYPDPNPNLPPPSASAENQLTEEDIFKMKSLTRNSLRAGGAGTSETADQSIISLADSASNFDEHVGEEFDEVEVPDTDSDPGKQLDPQNRIFNGWLFGRNRLEDFKLNQNTITTLKYPRRVDIPPCPEGIDDPGWYKAFEEATLYLIGTAHFSKESQQDVTETIKATQPDYVMVELCPARISILSMDEAALLNEAKELSTKKMINTIKQNGMVQGMLHVLLLSISAHVTRELSMAPGGEFRAAHRAAMQTQLCRVILGDRPIQVTLQRALASFSPWQKIRFFAHVVFCQRESITPEEVERCKQRDMLEELLAEMAGDFPQLSQIFVEERDAYMVHVLHSLLMKNTAEKRISWLNRNSQNVPWQPLSVVAVVGIGHTPGILSRWEDPVDFAPLLVIPPPTLTSKIVKTTFRVAFWGAAAYLIYRGASRARNGEPNRAMDHRLRRHVPKLCKYDFFSTGPEKTGSIRIFFAYSEDLTDANYRFIESSLSSDIELVGNVAVEGRTAPLIGDGFTINCTTQLLESRNVTDFLDINGMFNNEPVFPEGLSLCSKVGFEFSLREGREMDDVRYGAERIGLALFRFVFINAEKDLIIRDHKEKEKALKQLDEFSKGAVPYKDHIDFVALQSLTRDTSNDSEDQKLVPTVRITKDGKHFTKATFVVDVVGPAFFGNDSLTIYQRMSEAFRRRVNNVMSLCVNSIKKQRGIVTTTSATFLPPNWPSFLHLQLPTSWLETEQKAYRQRLHQLFNLPSTQPCLRLAQSLSFSNAKSGSKLLRSPHTSITNYKQIGVVSLVRGAYNYHHYMQDGMDDSGWGCAYRSLQSIWSWFVLNGYTDKPVPSHREIQQCLVDIGDKEQKFLGSRQWIGSTEISFVLQTLLNIESRFIATNSGAEVVERARELARHFDTVGSPVMIGGNMLAHTILGVDFNDGTGETKFLVLDPHYTGSEDLKTVISKGWCNWKPSSFWSTEHFYNIVLPQPPTDNTFRGLRTLEASIMAEELERVRAEAARLSQLLEEATADKIKAAEYGMLLLEQKDELEKKLTRLQAELDVTKAEVDKANQSLLEFRSHHQKATRSELENEESLLEESSAKERQLLERITSLEAELKQREQELIDSRAELQRIHNEHSRAADSGAMLEDERRKLKSELKETKEREQRLLAEYSELEEENIALQKTVANLRGAQVEFESLKIDCSRYEEEIYMLNAAVVESEALRAIAEKQVIFFVFA
ncbi:unnamed protein product [Caenorhabditis auriculariae]|uniref:Ufm1-specific protease n=1 Tax=Caenorhabditis auriculariae TaxID=2777116 RepID=A0A8S1HL67_9PELO|nr:unnamed protein product [Caenorhabditis auriculariae]